VSKLTTAWSALFLTVLCAAAPARGQDQVAAPRFDCSAEADPFKAYCDDIDIFLSDANANKTPAGKIDRGNLKVTSDLRAFLYVDSSPDRFASLVASKVAIENAVSSLPQQPDAGVLSGVNQNRPDQQLSPNSSASGSTSLVEKAGGPAILGFALESGALTRSVNGNTATLTGDADGLLRALTGRQVLCFDCGEALGTPILRDISLSASFLIDQQSTASAAVTGAANSSTPSSISSILIPKSVGKFSSFTSRYQIWNPYDPRSPKFLSAWNFAVQNAHDKIESASKAFQQDLQKLLVKSPLSIDDKLQTMLANYAKIFFDDADAGDLSKFRQDFLDLYNGTLDAWKRDDPEFNQKVAGLNVSLAQYRSLWKQILDQAKGQPLFTVEYSFNRPVSQPETHDFRLVYGYTPSTGVGLLSVNAAISIYGSSIPSGAKYGRLRDGQVSAEYDRPITLSGDSNRATVSLAGYWQYQPNPSVLNISSSNLAPGTNIELPQNAQVLLGTAGSLWVAQLKVTVNGKSGIKIPVAVKWSNKTDLLSGNKFGAQVGISYDFSSLSSLFGGSTAQ